MMRFAALTILITACLAQAAPPAPPPPPSSTLALTRPNPYELQSKAFRVTETVRAKLDCTAIRMKFGKGTHTGAWIVDTDSGRDIWRTDPTEGEPVGSSRILYRQNVELELPAGRYALYQFGGGPWLMNNPFKSLSSVLNDLADLINKEDPQADPEKYYGKCFVTMVSEDGRAVFGPVFDDSDDGCLIDMRRIEDNTVRTQTFRVDRRLKMQLTVLGEGDKLDTRFFDFGWLEKAGSGEPVWMMEKPYCLHAGGGDKNYISSRTITLEPGFYTAGYVSDSSHAYGSWNVMPPSMPTWWGLCLDAGPEAAANIELLDDADLRIPDVLVSLLRAGDDEKLKAVFDLERETELTIHAMGEGRSGSMFDYGWITDLDSGQEVWMMDWADCRHAGGTRRNVVFDGRLTLPAGRYQAVYITDDSHAFGAWNSPSPDESFRYGMVVLR